MNPLPWSIFLTSLVYVGTAMWYSRPLDDGHRPLKGDPVVHGVYAFAALAFVGVVIWD